LPIPEMERDFLLGEITLSPPFKERLLPVIGDHGQAHAGVHSGILKGVLGLFFS
jgi:hypothetical protein